MAENQDNAQALAKATAFFERARKVAETNNFDYAIDMYLEGLRCAPNALQEGHIPLRELGLLRQKKDGKKPSMVEKAKHLRGKTPLEQMLNAEYLFAKDPEHLPYAASMLKAAAAGDYKSTAMWVADLIFGANNSAKKPSFQTYMLLKDSYSAIGQYDRALAACQHAVKLKPQDGSLADEFQRLSAELTVSRGRYDQGGDFRDSIKDRKAQEKLHAQQGIVKTKDYRLSAVEDARKTLAENPDSHRNIFNLAQTLSDMQDEDRENEAIELLEGAYESKKDFSFKQRGGQIKITQLKRKIRNRKGILESSPDNAKVKAELVELGKQLNGVELEHYRLSVANYPTDLDAKYEYGICLIRNKEYDEAIPLFQEAQRDPRHKIVAANKIGLCFFKKGWFADAIDVFNHAIEAYEMNDDSIAKELRYNLGCSYQQQGDAEKAIEIFRKLAQLDFGYKDVRKRVDELRNSGK